MKIRNCLNRNCVCDPEKVNCLGCFYNPDERPNNEGREDFCDFYEDKADLSDEEE